MDVASMFPVGTPVNHQLPEYNGFGSLEDSEQNCKKINPDRPKKNYIKMLANGNEKLRFKAKMVFFVSLGPDHENFKIPGRIRTKK